jgi:hypothetical protein
MIRPLSFRKNEQGVTAVEFAFVAPAFLMLLFGIMQLSIWALSAVSVQHAAELAARCAAVRSAACGCSAAGCSIASVRQFAASQVVAFEVPTETFAIAGIGVADASCNGVKVSAAYTPFSFTAGWGIPTYTTNASACYPASLIPPV